MPPRPSLGRIIHRCSLHTSLVATLGPPCVCAPGFHCSSFSVESLPAYTRAHQIKPSGGFEPPPPASGTLDAELRWCWRVRARVCAMAALGRECVPSRI
ncbi:hypothetical protein PF003_g33884 [Phytophthora fragariae]|uniref:Uncharacterized protein n=1 Tax=Phytophthora fragariae TaxID=53985 RepID=A0A6A3DZN3_9STRA|nr:hypothetical protein PF003_g33884 [Phytophthora fragariae]KAE8927179.1 hypothetical protein PF009_g22646 [Phytophthora fragariae]